MSKTKCPIIPLEEVLKRLQRFGIAQREGKETYIILEGKKLAAASVARYVVDSYKADRDVHGAMLQAILRRFEISVEDFFEDSVH